MSRTRCIRRVGCGYNIRRDMRGLEKENRKQIKQINY